MTDSLRLDPAQLQVIENEHNTTGPNRWIPVLVQEVRLAWAELEKVMKHRDDLLNKLHTAPAPAVAPVRAPDVVDAELVDVVHDDIPAAASQ